MLVLLLGAPALATDWYLETPDQADRPAATTLQEQALAAGHEARVVRRFADGEGWRFVVRVEGFEEAAAAETAARALADALDVRVSLFESDGTTATRLADVAPAGAPPAPPADELPDAAPFLAAAVEAIGLADDTFDRARSGPALLEFRRTLPDGRTIEHTWAARDGAVSLEVRAVSGRVTESRTLVNADGAWLSTAGGPWLEQNPEKTRATIEQLGPLEVVPVVLALAAAVETRREFERMALVGKGEADGVVTDVLRFAGDAVSAPLELELGDDDHLLRRVRFGEEVVYELSGWKKSGRLTLPTHIDALRDGQLLDSVEIQRLDLAPELPESGFATPR